MGTRVRISPRREFFSQRVSLFVSICFFLCLAFSLRLSLCTRSLAHQSYRITRRTNQRTCSGSEVKEDEESSCRFMMMITFFLRHTANLELNSSAVKKKQLFLNNKIRGFNVPKPLYYERRRCGGLRKFRPSGVI
uniref:Uncharacterized protein n=1 Tax=Rhipicephalus appendiculatus TaxID=34631 RepID=A0A131YMZ9_RHIAP